MSPDSGVVKRAGIEIGWMLGGLITALVIGVLALSIFNFFEDLNTKAHVERIDVQREGDRREFTALVRELRHLGLKIPKGVVAQTPSHSGQQASPGSQPGHRGHNHGTLKGTVSPPKSHKPTSHAESRATPTDIPPPTTAPSSAPQSPPLTPGSTPAPSVGAKACIDLAVSACVKTP